MRLFLLFSCSLLTYSKANEQVEQQNTENGQKDASGDASASNSSYYSTKEMRDMVLKEWGGRTHEIQEYFDQLPSEEFKENSEDLKFMHYYERKGVEDVNSNQVYNITPRVYTPPGSEHTIEVNSSYIPKYRITTSEEIRMENYGTFNSESDSEPSPKTKSNLSKENESSEHSTEPPDSSGIKPVKKKRKGKKKWPSNMDPTEIRKKKKKRKELSGSQNRRKKMIETELNSIYKTNLRNIQPKYKTITGSLGNKQVNAKDLNMFRKGNSLSKNKRTLQTGQMFLNSPSFKQPYQGILLQRVLRHPIHANTLNKNKRLAESKSFNIRFETNHLKETVLKSSSAMNVQRLKKNFLKSKSDATLADNNKNNVPAFSLSLNHHDHKNQSYHRRRVKQVSLNNVRIRPNI